jgi:hypothetical protein
MILSARPKRIIFVRQQAEFIGAALPMLARLFPAANTVYCSTARRLVVSKALAFC